MRRAATRRSATRTARSTFKVPLATGPTWAAFSRSPFSRSTFTRAARTWAELPATAAAITTRGSFSGRTVARRSFPGRSELAIGRTATPLPLFFRIIRKKWRPLREKIAIQ